MSRCWALPPFLPSVLQSYLVLELEGALEPPLRVSVAGSQRSPSPYPSINASHGLLTSTCVTSCVRAKGVSVVSDSTPRTVAPQAPLSMGILQARILGWVAIPSSRGSSNPGI